MVFRLGLSASLLAGRIAETLCPNYQHRALVFDLSSYYLKAKVHRWWIMLCGGGLLLGYWGIKSQIIDRC